MSKLSLREFKTLLPYLVRYRTRYTGGVLCLITVDIAQLLIPQFIRRAVDLIASGNFQWGEVLILAGSMIGVMGIIALGRFSWRYFIHGASRRIETEMRDKLFAHLLTLSYDFYQNTKIGDLMARSTNDLNAIRESIGMGLVALLDGTVMAVSILVIIFLQDAQTAVLGIIPLPFITLIILFFGSAVGKKFRKAQETYSAMSDTVQETFAGIRVLKSFVKEWWFIKKFADTNDDYQDANMALVKLYGVFFPFISFLSGLTSLMVLLIGGIRVVKGFISPGDLVALFRYFQMLIWPLIGAGFVVNMIQRGAVSLGRVNEIMGTLPAIASPQDPQIPVVYDKKPLRDIEIRDLSFTYPGGNRVLDSINLRIKEGAVVGILGRTGSGKSTLIKSFTRMVDPPPGTVFVKGLAVGDWNLQQLRGLFGVIPQDTYLFSDTIKNNITYGLKHPVPGDENPIKKAVNLSLIARDLEGFSQGWDTVIGERGLTLSGGQKQRVAISRAVIGEPEFLILDDALSAVDAETEKRILTELLKERQGKTTIIISHRVSTLHNADPVVVLDKGRIVELGAPRDLIAQGGFYARMAALQQLDHPEEGSGV